MANVWHPELNAWVDDVTGNKMVPTDIGGDGLWHSPDGRVFNPNTNQWTSPSTNPQAASSVSASTPGSVGTGAFTAIPGSDYATIQLNADVAAKAAAALAQSQKDLQALQASQAKEIAGISAAASKYVADSSAKSAADLQAGKITADAAAQQRQLAQEQAQFAQDLALKQLTEQHNYDLGLANNKVQQAQVAVSQAAEARSERELQANLNANPQDWLAYQFYKRSLGTPATQQAASQGSSNPGSMATTAAATAPDGTPLDTTGSSYSSAPPAYSDESIQAAALGLTAKGAAYNTNLGGTGAFGASVPTPNALSRNAAANLDPSSQAMLTGLLKAGVQTQPGNDASRVALSPDDWFKQAAASWTPTLSGAGQYNQYQ